MANQVTTSDVRQSVAKDRNGNTGNGNSRRGATRGRLNLRDERQVPDEVLRKEIERGKREVRNEVGLVSFEKNDKAAEALRYFTFLRVALLVDGEEPPSSISHARRYRYENTDEQLEYWRKRLIRALRKI